MRFEWDRSKAESNLKKHGVPFQEALTVFADPLAITYNDPDHSAGEHRFLTFGATIKGRLVVVSHLDQYGTIRLIGSRLMTKHERRIYEEG